MLLKMANPSKNEVFTGDGLEEKSHTQHGRSRDRGLPEFISSGAISADLRGF
jgi:hypothetical protein